MKKSNQFQEIPEDVKKEMLMLFETYSKAELINKLRSLRESPEKSLAQSGTVAASTSSRDIQNQLNFYERVNPKNDALVKAHNHEQDNNTNVSHHYSHKSPVLQTNHQNPEIEQLHSINNLVSVYSEIDSSPNYDCIKSNPLFNPVVLLQKIDLSKINHEAFFSLIPNPINEDVAQKNVSENDPLTNVRKVKNRKLARAKTNIQMNTSDKDSSRSVPDKSLEKCPDVRKVSNVSPKANIKSKSQLKSINKFKKDDQFEGEQEGTPINVESDIKSPSKTTSSVSKKLIPKNKLSKENDITLEVPKNGNVSVTESSTADNNVNTTFDKNKGISVKSTARKKRSVKLLKSTKITNSSDVKVPDSDLQNFHSETNTVITVKGRKRIDNVKNAYANSSKKSNKRRLLCRNVKLTSNADSEKQPVANSDINTGEVNHYLSTKIASNDPIKASKCADSGSTTELNSSDQVIVSRSTSSRKRKTRCLSNSENISSLQHNVLKKKTSNCSYAEIEKQPLSFTVMTAEQDLVSKIASRNETIFVSPAISAETSLPDPVPVTKSVSLKKLSSEISSNIESVSNSEKKVLNKKISSCPNVVNEEECQNKRETHRSNQSVVQNAEDIILTSKLQERIKSNDEVKICEDLDEMQQNAEAYSKLSKLCSVQGLNLDDIFRRKEIKEMIEKYKNNTDAIVFLGTHKCQSTGKINPVVHVHKSKKVLLETLAAIQNKNSNSSKVCK